jgi:hypothetical protein
MRKEKRVTKSPGRALFCEGGELAGDHFGVDFGDGAGDAEAPGEDGVGFKFIGDDVLVGGVGEGNAGVVHFFGLHVEVVEEIAEVPDAFLATDGAVAGDEESVFVPGSEGLESFAPAGHGALFVEAGGIGVAENQVAGVHDFLIGDADDEVGTGMAGIVFDDDGKVAEVEIHRKLRGIKRMIGKCDWSFVGHIEDVADGGEIALGVLAGDVVFGVLDAFFGGSEESGAVCALHDDVGFRDALRNGGVSPELNAVGAVEGAAHGVVEVIVGEERVGGRELGDFAIGVHLKGGAGCGAVGFEEEAGVFADEEAAVANGNEALGGVGDGGVEAITDFADGGEAGVGDGRLGDARVVGDGRSKSRKWKRSSECVKSAEAGCVGEKLPAIEWSERVH